MIRKIEQVKGKGTLSQTDRLRRDMAQAIIDGAEFFELIDDKYDDKTLAQDAARVAQEMAEYCIKKECENRGHRIRYWNKVKKIHGSKYIRVYEAIKTNQVYAKIDNEAFEQEVLDAMRKDASLQYEAEKVVLKPYEEYKNEGDV